MSCTYKALCDDFYVSVRLGLKLDLTFSRETVLHFFDQIRKVFPQMAKLHRGDDNALALEEDRDQESYRWLRLERDALRFGQFNPPDLEDVDKLAGLVLEHAPYHLSLSEIDIDLLELLFGFDLEYQGNHDEIVAEALLGDHPLAGLLSDADHTPIEFQPNFGIALDRECSLQSYFEVKTRTSAYAVRVREFEKEPLSVYLTVQRYWGVGPSLSLGAGYRKLVRLAEQLADAKVIPLLLSPLARAIASRR